VSSNGSWTPLELVRWTTTYFERHSVPTPRLDAELLLAHVLGLRRIDLYLRFDSPVEAAARERYRALIRRRAEERLPIAYLTGEREFWSRSFRVTPDVLTPRPETEGVVEAVVALRPSLVVDAGTGSGAIACSLALELPEARVVALDRSVAALRVARENAERLGLDGRIGFVASRWLSALGRPADVIAANPPYIPSGELETLPPEVRHEPRAALDGGPDGLEAIRELIRDAPLHLRRPGAIVIEVGPDHAAPVEMLLRAAGAGETEIRKDLAGVERVVVGRFSEG
jgi:release factor glutamine methyltransferase